MKRLLEEREAAAMLNRSPYTLRNWRVQGIGPPWITDPMGAIHYDPDVLERWIRGELETDNNRDGKGE